MVSSITTSIQSTADRDPVSIPGLEVHSLTAFADGRGTLTEIYRSTWGVAAIHQWTVLTFGARVVRGPSVHRNHSDAVIALSGEIQIGLRDLREDSPAFRRPYRVTLSSLRPLLVVIPPGVMHAFYAATEPAVVLVGNTHEYDPDDDLKCRWQDVPLELDDSVIGTQDDRARALDDVIAALRS